MEPEDIASEIQIDINFRRLNDKQVVFQCCSYLGQPILKTQADLAEIISAIAECKPDVIIETGTAYGGTAYFYADLLKKTGIESDPAVITIENGLHNLYDKPSVNSYVDTTYKVQHHPRVAYFIGSTLAPGILGEIEKMVEGKRVLVNLDSDHHSEHVFNELTAYSKFVSPGSFLIVEDMQISDKYPEHGPGPDDAVARFLPDHKEFIRTDYGSKSSLNRGGFLKRI